MKASKPLKQKNNLIYLMMHHLRLIASFTLSFIVFSSLFSMDMSSLNKVYAATDNGLTATVLTLPLPKACVCDDGEEKYETRIPDDCEEISNNNDEGTLGKDNIFFTLLSTRGFDEYTCTLQNRDSGTVITTFDCFISNTVAEADFPNLEDGDYTFTVTALRTISDNNPLTPDTVKENCKSSFQF